MHRKIKIPLFSAFDSEMTEHFEAALFFGYFIWFIYQEDRKCIFIYVNKYRVELKSV